MPATLRQATIADTPVICDVRYSVTENTLTRGRIAAKDVRREIVDTRRGRVSDDAMHGKRRADLSRHKPLDR